MCLAGQFADDNLLFFSASNTLDIEAINNQDLSIISAGIKKWLVAFNPEKTDAVLYSLRPISHLPQITFSNSMVQFEDFHKNLFYIATLKLKDYGEFAVNLSELLCVQHFTYGRELSSSYRYCPVLFWYFV